MSYSVSLLFIYIHSAKSEYESEKLVKGDETKTRVVGFLELVSSIATCVFIWQHNYNNTYKLQCTY